MASRVVQGTHIIHNELQAIRQLIADFYRHSNAGMPAPRQLGGPVYAQFGQSIRSGIVPNPTGRAKTDAQGLERGTDTYAATVPHGSFVGNVGMTNAFGYNRKGGIVYREDGGVPVMLTPGERVFSPQEVKQIGLAKLTAQNDAGRRMQNGGYLQRGGRVLYAMAGKLTYPSNFTVIDTESFDKEQFEKFLPDARINYKDELFQIAALPFRNGKIIRDKTIDTLVRPSGQTSLSNYKNLIETVRPEDQYGDRFESSKLLQAPEAKQVIQKLINLIGEDELLIGQGLLTRDGKSIVPGTDIRLLDALAQKLLGKRLLNPVQDTHEASYQIDRDGSLFTGGRELVQMVDTLGLAPDIKSKKFPLKPHDALLDAHLAARLYKKEHELAKDQGIQIHTFIPEIDAQDKIRYKWRGGGVGIFQNIGGDRSVGSQADRGILGFDGRLGETTRGFQHGGIVRPKYAYLGYPIDRWRKIQQEKQEQFLPGGQVHANIKASKYRDLLRV